ncbi:MAG: hypothetical protein L6R37_008363, partial [Teloschistes peruensis]
MDNRCYPECLLGKGACRCLGTDLDLVQQMLLDMLLQLLEGMLLQILLQMLLDMLLQMLLRMLLQMLLDMLLDMLLLQMPLHMLLQMLLQMPLATTNLGILLDILNNKILVPDEPLHAILVAPPALTAQAAPPRWRLGCILPNGEGTRRRSVKKMNSETDVSLVVARVVENPKRDVLWTT